MDVAFPYWPKKHAKKQPERRHGVTYKTSAKILRASLPPTQEIVSDIFGIKSKPEQVSYYHVATELPTKPSWLAATKNVYCVCVSLQRLNVSTAATYFTESEEYIERPWAQDDIWVQIHQRIYQKKRGGGQGHLKNKKEEINTRKEKRKETVFFNGFL